MLFYHAAFAAFVIGPLVAIVGNARVGPYIATAGFAAYHVAHRIFAVIGTQLSKRRPQPWPFVEPAALALLLGGLFTAMAGVRIGACLLLAGLGVQLLRDLIVGVTSYRETMHRPWPQVAPVLDDDDW